MKKILALSVVAVLCAVVTLAGDEKMGDKKMMDKPHEGTITKLDMAGKMMVVKNAGGLQFEQDVVTFDDAIAQGKPQLIVFATPQFCTSRMCGPVVDIVRSLIPTYGKRVAFIHQEIWQDFADKKVFPTIEEWRLITEPWIFVVDGQGIIRAKFEGLVTTREVESALQQILTRGPARQQ